MLWPFSPLPSSPLTSPFVDQSKEPAQVKNVYKKSKKQKGKKAKKKTRARRSVPLHVCTEALSSAHPDTTYLHPFALYLRDAPKVGGRQVLHEDGVGDAPHVEAHVLY
jgi:hypothetical protein